MRTPLAPDELERMNAYWRAANYLSVGQIYLKENPLLRRPLVLEDVKARLLGHWGTCPGLNLVYVHLNRVIKARDLDVIYVCGPGHGGPAMVANVYLEGTYSEYYNHIPQNETGHAAAVQAVLVPGRHPQPRGAGDSRVHQRGRGTGLLAGPRLRRGVRQPGADRRLRGGRRRGRDRRSRGRLAVQQVPRPGHRRRRAAHPAPERRQDRQPDGAGAHHPRRAGRLLRGAWATRPTSSRATTRPRCTSSWRPPWTTSSTRSPPSSAGPGKTAWWSARAGR